MLSQNLGFLSIDIGVAAPHRLSARAAGASGRSRAEKQCAITGPLGVRAGEGKAALVPLFAFRGSARPEPEYWRPFKGRTFEPLLQLDVAVRCGGGPDELSKEERFKLYCKNVGMEGIKNDRGPFKGRAFEPLL
jgi:hypothetical protein